jgi:VWFA-related protein
MRIARVVKPALIFLAVAAAAFAQSAPPPPPQPPPPQPSPQAAYTQQPLRVTSRLVQVDVTVLDKDGNQVTGLTKDDFTVLDQGQPQKIAHFAEQDSHPQPVATLTAAAPAPTHSFSNRDASGSRTSSTVTVILLDTVNTDWDKLIALMPFPFARGQVVKFIKSMQPGDQVALYLLTPSRLYMLHDFTSDSANLLEVLNGVDKTKSAHDPEAAAAEIQHKRLEKEATDAFAASNAYYKGDRPNKVAVTAEGMRIIASRLGRFPGRKNLVWISSGFPIQTGVFVGNHGDTHNYAGDISTVGQILSNADVAVYPVDARGLIGPDVFVVLQGDQGGGAPKISAAAPNDRPFETMLAFAAATGGHAFFNTNDISGSIRKAIDDSRVSYVIGYYPDHNKWDGSYREITVKVERPGAQLRYRKGYFATAEGSKTADEQKQILSTALASPIQLLDLGLELQIDGTDTPGARQIRARIHILPGQMQFQPAGDRFSDGVEVAWSELNSDGRVVGRGAHAFGLKPTQQGLDEIAQKGLTFSERVSVKSDATEMRLVVRDVGGGAMGTFNVPLREVFSQSPPPVAPKK